MTAIAPNARHHDMQHPTIFSPCAHAHHKSPLQSPGICKGRERRLFWAERFSCALFV